MNGVYPAILYNVCGDCVTEFRNIGISFPPWTAFLAVPSQNSWYQRHAGAEPVYALPEAFLKELAPLLPPEKLETECRFTQCCLETGDNVVGLWQAKPIVCNLIDLSDHRKAIPDDLIRSWRVTGKSFEAKRKFAKEVENLSEMARRNCIRLAGQLVVNPSYIAHRDALKSEWAPLTDIVPFPLARRGTATNEGKAVKSFILAVSVFLDRWQLTRLDTWDLPVPIGPYDSMPLKALALLYPDAKAINVSPGHMAVQKSGEATTGDRGRIKLTDEEVLRFKRALTEEMTSTEEWIFFFRHLEYVFRTRYGAPRGYREALTDAFKKCTGLGQERIAQIVKQYLPTMPPVVG